MASQGKRTVLVVNIEEGADTDSAGLFDSMYGSLMNKLKNHSLLNVSLVGSMDALEAKCIESNPNETVLLFTNDVVKGKKMQEIGKKFVNAGGLAIFGCLFSSFIVPPAMEAIFQNFGLPWKTSNYNRTTFGITDFGKSLLTGITEKFSVKALQLSNVLPNQMLYTPVENATTQSFVFPPESANPTNVMAAFGKIGSGAVAYIGDVNAEESCDLLIVALCLARW